MKRPVYYPKRLPEAVAGQVGFAPAVRSGDLLFISGLSAVYVDGDKIAIPEGATGQAASILEHLRDLVGAAGGTLDDVVDLTIFLRPDVTDAQVVEIGKALGAGFKPKSHADTWLRVQLVGPPQQLLQVKAIAHLTGA